MLYVDILCPTRLPFSKFYAKKLTYTQIRVILVATSKKKEIREGRSDKKGRH